MSSPLNLLVVLLAAVALAWSGAGAAAGSEHNGDVRATFSPTDADFPNPERGFYRAMDATLDALSDSEVADASADGFRLIYVRIDLEPFRTSALPERTLLALEDGFAAARAGGVKLILRATYNYPRSETEYRDSQDASLERVLSYLAQLKPVLMRNRDVIAFVQAGFIGAWGEWHTSSNGLTEPAPRALIRDAILEAVPGRFVQFRYPPFIQGWTPRLPTLNAALADDFRIGFHNDCFLASATDVGTYSEDAGQREAEQLYMDALGESAVFGGETCNPLDDPGAVARTSCDDIVREGARYNLTYLNDGYYRRLFHNRWIADGCIDAVRRHMGYRFSLLSVRHDPHVARGGVLSLSLAVRNEGWARLYNERPLALVLQHVESGAVHRLSATGADSRTWLPGRDSAADLAIAMPADLPVGAYDVLLALPDADARLAMDPRFSIRFANADDPARGQRWNEALAAFALGTTLVVD